MVSSTLILVFCLVTFAAIHSLYGKPALQTPRHASLRSQGRNLVYASIQTHRIAKCPQRNNLCNLLVIGISIGDLDCENQDVQ